MTDVEALRMMAAEYNVPAEFGLMLDRFLAAQKAVYEAQEALIETLTMEYAKLVAAIVGATISEKFNSTSSIFKEQVKL